MRRLIDALADDTDFFIEQVQITAIVFDNSDDVTIWATTFFDQEPHFFHLGLQFQQLDLLLRLAGERAGTLQEDVADALATVTEWPCLLEYTSEAEPPVPLPSVALKLSCTYPADGPFDEDETDEDDSADDTFNISIDPDADEADSSEYEASMPHNIFYLEDVFLRVEP